MAVKKVEVPDLGTVHLFKRKGVRSIRLSIGHEGELRVSLPYWMPYGAAIEFVRSKQEWISSKRIIVEPLAHGGRIGKAHTLRFVPEPGRTALATRITNTGEVRVFMPNTMTPAHPEAQKAAQRASVRALKQQAERLLPQRLEDLARQHGFSYNAVSVKQLKTRWGSCTEKSDIALNVFLMQLPWRLIDYVLLHELVHTRIMAHGPVFWDELGHYIPDLKAVRKEMKTYRPVLLAQAL